MCGLQPRYIYAIRPTRTDAFDSLCLSTTVNRVVQCTQGLRCLGISLQCSKFELQAILHQSPYRSYSFPTGQLGRNCLSRCLRAKTISFQLLYHAHLFKDGNNFFITYRNKGSVSKFKMQTDNVSHYITSDTKMMRWEFQPVKFAHQQLLFPDCRKGLRTSLRHGYTQLSMGLLISFMNHLVLGVSFRTWAMNVRPDAVCG